MLKIAALATLCYLSLSTIVNASEQRWFEVEVIIFSQTPPADLKENFDQPIKPIRPGRSFDLVTPLFQPDISTILNTLPLCPMPDSELSTTPVLNPRYYYKLDNLCIFEPQNSHWQHQHFMQSRYIDNRLPMPDRIPAELTTFGKHVNQAYIVSKNDLQLSDIKQRLQQQTDKKVLLHTAWRQVPVTQRRAIASHWYAGNNLTKSFDYWGQPKLKQDAALNQTSQLTPELASNPETEATDQVDIVSNIEQLLAQLNANPQLPLAKSITTVDENNSPSLEQNQQLLTGKIPDYTWQLDGLFKLHLDHYLFVNTEFNLRVPEADQLKTVYVKQSRRVISGEIHYLDHPYLGIILQIRRFEPPLDNLELESEPSAEGDIEPGPELILDQN
ncbi:CsiV family protein [Rheinheimera sp. WS51]|uniref:CsiV family protein n=1 Tax=Rheinheimera sp. WS51 TaxID=3425886 RepID=UPI003D8C58F7